LAEFSEDTETWGDRTELSPCISNKSMCKSESKFNFFLSGLWSGVSILLGVFFSPSFHSYKNIQIVRPLKVTNNRACAGCDSSFSQEQKMWKFDILQTPDLSFFRILFIHSVFSYLFRSEWKWIIYFVNRNWRTISFSTSNMRQSSSCASNYI
jgi:hypothetical protein